MPENNSSQGRRNPLVRQNHLGRRAPNESQAASLSALAVQRARGQPGKQSITSSGRRSQRHGRETSTYR